MWHTDKEGLDCLDELGKVVSPAEYLISHHKHRAVANSDVGYQVIYRLLANPVLTSWFGKPRM